MDEREPPKRDFDFTGRPISWWVGIILLATIFAVGAYWKARY